MIVCEDLSFGRKRRDSATLMGGPLSHRDGDDDAQADVENDPRSDAAYVYSVGMGDRYVSVGTRIVHHPLSANLA